MEIYQPEQHISQQSYSNQQPILSPLQPALSGPVNYQASDASFLKWLFSFREESVVPLRNAWRGKEFRYDIQRWVDPEDHEPHAIMNETGISWSISLIESYFSPVFLTTDLTRKSYNFRMREVTRVIWNSLSLRYKEFNLRKSDIHRVAEEIESKISAILLGAIDDGFRQFFSTTNSYNEVRNLTTQPEGDKPSIFSGISRIFKKDQPQQGGY